MAGCTAPQVSDTRVSLVPAHLLEHVGCPAQVHQVASGVSIQLHANHACQCQPYITLHPLFWIISSWFSLKIRDADLILPRTWCNLHINISYSFRTMSLIPSEVLIRHMYFHVWFLYPLLKLYYKMHWTDVAPRTEDCFQDWQQRPQCVHLFGTGDRVLSRG